MTKREDEAFERAALRQERAAKLKRELTDREAAMSEREFDDAIALYLKKRELTRALSIAASRAKAATPASTP
jgi:acetyl-CoA carboxylase carboxyltransferase component